MMLQKTWDKYEVALLIECYEKIKDGENRKKALMRLSNDLRNMAILAGKDIDDTYRNYNGMTWQFAILEKTFQEANLGSHKPSRLFVEMIELYQNNRPQYERYLDEARAMISCQKNEIINSSENTMKDLKNSFVAWLQMQNKLKAPISLIVSTLDECSEYATKHGVSEIDFWSISNPNIYDSVAKSLMGMRLFSVIHRKTAKQFNKFFIYYKNFLEVQKKELASNKPPQSRETSVISLSATVQIAEENPFNEEMHLAAFSDWLGNADMSPTSCKGYVSNLRSLLVFCKNHSITDINFLSASDSDLVLFAGTIFSNEEFLNYNAEQHNRYSAAIKKYLEFRLGTVEIPGISRRAARKGKKKKEETYEYRYQESIISILTNRYPYGYRVESSIEMNRLRKYASIDDIVLPESDEDLKREILHAGLLIEDKVFAIEENTIFEIKNCFNGLSTESNSQVIFFETIMNCCSSTMDEHHITSEEMLREIVAENVEQIFEEYKDVYIAKNFISFIGKCTEREAVTIEMKRVWGSAQTMQVDALTVALPCIPDRYIAQYLTANKSFVWVSEGVYMSVDKLIITQKESEAIYNFVSESCEKQGYAPLSEIPLGNMVEENYELSELPLLNAIYNKILSYDFHLNGKILTKDNNGLDVVTLAKQYIAGRDECTFTEVNEKVSELSGVQYRYMAYEALYSSMVRIDEEHYVADKHVRFDVDVIDDILSKMIIDDFAAIKEITTFAVFPMCGQAWNHYLLESYCYKFSKKYKLKVLNFNDKNAGMIVDKSLDSDYNELLARAAARSKIELSPENIGTFFFEAGYMGKRKFSDLEAVTERAKEIREE